MNSLILIGLIAFLIIDVLLLVLFLRWDESKKKSGEESPKVNRGATESQASTPAEHAEKTALPEKVTKPLSVETNVSASPETTQPAGGEHVFDLAHDKPADAKESRPAAQAPPAHDSNQPPVVTSISLSKYSVDNGQVTREHSYLRQKATILETRIAALNESSETMTDFQRGMKAVLEEELHTTRTRMGELKSQARRLNLVSA